MLSCNRKYINLKYQIFFDKNVYKQVRLKAAVINIFVQSFDLCNVKSVARNDEPKDNSRQHFTVFQLIVLLHCHYSQHTRSKQQQAAVFSGNSDRGVTQYTS